MNLWPSNRPTSISRKGSETTVAVSTELFTLSSKTRIDMIDIIDMMCLLLLPQESPAVSKNWDSGWVFELRSWDMKAWQSESQMEWIASVSTAFVATVAQFWNDGNWKLNVFLELQIVLLSNHIMAHWSRFCSKTWCLDSWPELKWVMRLECQGGAASKRCQCCEPGSVAASKGPKGAEMSGNRGILGHWAWPCLPLKGTRS